MRRQYPTRYARRWALPDALKGAGVALAVIVVCLVPLLILWPESEATPPGTSLTTTTVVPAQAAASSTTTSASTTTSTTEPPPVEITIAAVGDVMGVASVRKAAWDVTAKKYDYYPMFEPVTPYLAGADYAVCNLESRLADLDSGTDGVMILNSPVALGDALKQAGFDLCAMANNHSLDKGYDGMVQTLDRLDEIGLAHIGCYRSAEDKQARTPFIVDIKGIKVAFINYTDLDNGLPLAAKHKGYAVNFLGADAAAAEATAAREAGAEVVVMIVHWGKEKKTKQNSSQTKVAVGAGDYQGLLQRGVDVILGAHPHVVQPAARVTYQTESGSRDAYVVYSMGNFLPPTSVPWPQDSGLVAYVHIVKEDGVATVTGLSYLPMVRQAVDGKVRLLPVLPGLQPHTDTVISETTQARMDKAWNYYKAMYDKPEDNIVPLDLAELSATKE